VGGVTSVAYLVALDTHWPPPALRRLLAIMTHGIPFALVLLAMACLVAHAVAVGIAPNATLAPNTTTPEATTTPEPEPIKPTIQTRGETIAVTAAKVFAVEADDITFTNAKQPYAQEDGDETVVDISILR